MNQTARTILALRETGERMVTEWDDLPAGSVLRCYSRAVRTVVRAGCPPARVPAEAERIARAWLDLRRAPGASVLDAVPETTPDVAPPPVPRPRTAA